MKEELFNELKDSIKDGGKIKIINDYLEQATDYEKRLIIKKKQGTVEGYEYITTPFEHYLLNKLDQRFQEGRASKEAEMQYDLEKTYNKAIDDCLKITKEKQEMHMRKFKEWHEETGNVMNGHWIRADACKEISEAIEQLKDTNYNPAQIKNSTNNLEKK